MSAPVGVLLVDKPPAMTSHDVVARVRRALGTRKVGHAGTLDPMATGLLVIGVGPATRLLGHLSASHKTYRAEIELGVGTDTLDADGQIIARGPADIDDDALAAALAALTGSYDQMPPAYSAVKVGGVRSYAAARRGESVELTARPVTIDELTMLNRAGARVTIEMTCSAGTYVRALARDLGERLGTYAHLSSLRRIRSGSFDVADACALDDVTLDRLITPAAAAARALPVRQLAADESVALGHGGSLAATGVDGVVAAIGDGELVALIEDRDGRARPVAVLRTS
jgi:tRNA pseudouridine55 synthase